MNDWFSEIGAGRGLLPATAEALDEVGFVVISGPVTVEGLVPLAGAYDAAMTSADLNDVGNGSSTTRVHDFVNRGPEFDALYVYQPVLDACYRIIGQPFRLNNMLARTLRPQTRAQALHVDFKRDAGGWTMVGFIFMVDEFRAENGATRFVPGSHRWSTVPGDLLSDPVADCEGQVRACGPAGSIILYNGSVWHGHAANSTDKPRRSIQGAYIRRKAQSGFDLSARMRSDTLARISPLAKYILAV
jgi:ectoine hydroxylase-related dioxygenase (phytanoyl-CoA dioxygenase family)